MQFGSFAQPANAARMQAELKKHGYDGVIVPYAGSGKDLSLVQISSFADRNAAAEAAAAIQRDAGIGALLLKSAQ